MPPVGKMALFCLRQDTAGVGDPNRASSSNIDQKSVHTDNDGKLLKRPRIIFGNRRTKSKASKSKPTRSTAT